MTSEEQHRLERRIAALEESNRRMREDFGRAASEHARVASVLAAFHRLHSTLERGAMLIALHQVLAGLVGCEEAAVFERTSAGEGLALAACFGVSEKAVMPFPEPILRSVLAGKPFMGVADPTACPRRPGVCIPLRVDGRVVGAIAIYGLAGHKQGLSGADWDLLETLGTHAGTALFATRPSVAVADRC